MDFLFLSLFLEGDDSLLFEVTALYVVNFVQDYEDDQHKKVEQLQKVQHNQSEGRANLRGVRLRDWDGQQQQLQSKQTLENVHEYSEVKKVRTKGETVNGEEEESEKAGDDLRDWVEG